MTSTTDCSVKHFDGYVIEPRDIKEDPQLEEEVKAWIEAHPEYLVVDIYAYVDSGGYEMSVRVYYKRK